MGTEELIVYVDKAGKPTGETAPKAVAHHSRTRLHLAFSCYLFNESGEILVTQRARDKRVWPGVWTNSVCGHPGPNETMPAAIERRLRYELAIPAYDLQVMLADYTYKAPACNGIVEYEFCPVYFARTKSMPLPNPAEVAAYRWLSWPDFVDEALSDTDDSWSWWCKDQLKILLHEPASKHYRSRAA